MNSGPSSRQVMCRSGNLAKTIGFYKDVLGMSDVAVPELVPKRGSMAAVSCLAQIGHLCATFIYIPGC